MKRNTQKRWIKSIIKTAQEDTPALPWQRGARRARFVAARKTNSLQAKTA